MPNTLDTSNFPKPGNILTGKNLSIKDTDTLISFNQAFKNASEPKVFLSKDESYDGKNLLWTTDINVELPIRINANGFSSEPPITLIEAFANAVKTWSSFPSLFYKPKGHKNKPWVMYTWQDYWNNCCKFAKSLINLGLKEKSVTCIMGFNSPSWLIANFGAIFMGGISSGIYPSSNPEIVKYIINHCEASVIVVDTVANLEKILMIKNEIPTVKKIIMYYDEVTPYLISQGIVSFYEFLDYGKSISDQILSSKMSNQSPGQCATLIYTSGTTGPPKAVMLSHDNSAWTGWITSKYTCGTNTDSVVSYLPLCHIAAQIIDIYSSLFIGHHVYFADIDALQGSLLFTLKEVRPTWFLGVPRVFEKMESALRSIGSQGSSLMKKISAWARNIGYEGTLNLFNGDPTSKSYQLVDQLILNKIRKALGLDRCKAIAVTAAPVMKTTQEYFLSLGMPLCNIYGLSEITGPHSFSINAPYWFKLGSAGLPFSGTESYIHNPDETGIGEVCIRGRHVFMGYFKDEKATKAAIDENGFFHSGDTGYFDEKGFLYIVGRIKELIITAGGENIAPLSIENYVKKFLPLISNCQVIGDGRPYLSLLICLRSQINPDGLPSSQLDPEVIKELRSYGSNSTSTIEASTDDVLSKIIEEGIANVNQEVPSRAQQIRKWAILPYDFSELGGELTSTLKLKRAFVIKKYSHLIDSLYKNENTLNSKL